MVKIHKETWELWSKINWHLFTDDGVIKLIKK